MAKKGFKKFWSFIMWLVALLVALAVGFGMTSGTLFIKWIPTIVTVIAGWIVVITTLIGLIVAIIDVLK
jgi:hypothetical protein